MSDAEQWFLTGGEGVNKFPGGANHYAFSNMTSFWTKSSVQFIYLKSGGLKQWTIV